MWIYLSIAIGGTLGCWARYAVGHFVQTLGRHEFPYATFGINVLGSFLMGFLFILTLNRLAVPQAVRIGVLTGVLGGFTTFSTFEMDVVLLAEHGEVAKAVLYIVLSVGIGLLGALFGAHLARAL